MYRELRDRNTVFTGLLAEFPFDASVAARGQTERASGELVSGNYFDLLGVPPALGRTFTPDDDRAPGAHPLAVLSHGYWTRRFGNDAGIVNNTITVNGHLLTVVGVSRAGYTGIQPGRPADLFVPIAMKAQMTPFWNGLDNPKDYWVQLAGRVKPGLSAAQAQAALQAVYRPLLQEHLPSITGWSESRRLEFANKKILLVPGGRGRTVMREGLGKPLVSVMGMVALVLLIACSNLAGLLAARGAARQREYGIRLAIGASRAQLLRQSIVECLLFAFAGGAVGILVAAWTLHTLLAAFPADADLRLVAAQIDPRVIGLRGARVAGRGPLLRHFPGAAGGPPRPGPHAPGPGARIRLGRARRPALPAHARHGAGGADARPARGRGPLRPEPGQRRPRRARA